MKKANALPFSRKNIVSVPQVCRKYEIEKSYPLGSVGVNCKVSVPQNCN